MSVTLERPRVPAEHVGQARVFRDAVKRTDEQFERIIRAIARPLHLRLRRHPRLRHEMIAQAVRQYRAIPPDYRLTMPEITPSRDAFAISEPRLCASRMTDADWHQPHIEPGVAVLRFVLALAGGRLTVRWQPVALCSLHSLSRWVERTGRRDHAALVHDLAALIDGDLTGGCIAASGGYWMGAMVGMRGREGPALVKSIRTAPISGNLAASARWLKPRQTPHDNSIGSADMADFHSTSHDERMETAFLRIIDVFETENITPSMALDVLTLAAEGVMVHFGPGERDRMVEVFLTQMRERLTETDTKGTA
jgi:hypothetical protein